MDDARERLRAGLQRKMRFLLPPWIAIFVGISLLFMLSDAAAVAHQIHDVVMMFLIGGGMLLLLAWNVILHHRLERRLKRLLAGQCIFCGYDLRGSAARCPECGAALDDRPVA